MARSTKRYPTTIVALSIVFSLFFIGQIAVILQPRYNVSEEEFVLSFDKGTNVDDEDDVHKKSSGAVASKKEELQMGPADGTFNTFPIYHRDVVEGWHSNAHCIGDNFQPDAWKYRSCHFQNLCFDTEDRAFVLFTSPEQHKLEESLADANLTHFSPASSMNTTVSLGGINPKWNKEVAALDWYPRLRPVEEIKEHGYYVLPSDKVLIPYHSMAGMNPGHLVWDDFLPLFTLLTAFQLIEKEMVLIRYDMELAMWASCQRLWEKCRPILKKFYPLLNTKMNQTSTQNDTAFEIVGGGEKKSKYVCAPNGAAGLGMLTDHGLKLHGWRPSDYEYAYNIGRGGSLFQFRNWMMDNIGVAHEGRNIHKPPYRIIVSSGSSTQGNRRVSFHDHAVLLQERLGKKYELDIREVKLAKMSLTEQVELVAGASIFITICGGGAITAMFMPKGATLLAFFNEKDANGETPARLDWDLLNNIGYLRVHWLPRPQAAVTKKGTRTRGPDAADLEAFVRLVDHELDVISHTNDY